MQTLKEMKWNAIISSILMIVLGVVLVLFPTLSMNLIVTFIAIAAIISGLVNIIRYFSYDLKESYFRNDFLFGLVTLTLGILILFKPEMFIALIPLILGVVIIYSGFSKLQDGIDAKRFGYPNSLLYIVLAFIDIILCLFVLFNPFSAAGILFIVIGLGLMYSGISDLFVTLYLAKKFKDYYKDLN